MTAKPKNGKHLITRNDELDKKMKKHPDLNTNIETLFAIGRRNRKLIKLVYFLVVLEVITGIAVTYFASQVVINKANTQSNHTALLNSCNSSNDFRKDNLALWTYILAIKPPEPPNDAQKKITVDFTKFVSATFALRDCSKIK